MNIFIFKSGEQQGPYTVAEARRRCVEGKLSETDPAWYEGLSDWIPLNQVPGFSIFTGQAPIITPPAAPKLFDQKLDRHSGGVAFLPRRKTSPPIAESAVLFAAWAAVLFLLIYGAALFFGGGIAATQASWNHPNPSLSQSWQSAMAVARNFDARNGAAILFWSVMASGLMAVALATWASSTHSVAHAFGLFKRFAPVGVSLVPTLIAFSLLIWIPSHWILAWYFFSTHPFPTAASNPQVAAQGWAESFSRYVAEYQFTTYAVIVLGAAICTAALSLATFLKGFEAEAAVFFKRLATTYVLFVVFFTLSGLVIFLLGLAFGIHLTASDIMSATQSSTANANLTAGVTLNFLAGLLGAVVLSLLASLFFAFQIAFSEALPWCRKSPGPTGTRRLRTAL